MSSAALRLSEELRRQLEVEETARFIARQRFGVVCLQLPNHMLRHAAPLVSELQRACLPHEVSLHVLADTTSSDSCCVDEVGAAHVQADCVVHYGRACLTYTSRTAAFFVLGQAPLSVSHCAQQIVRHRQGMADAQAPLLVVYDLKLSYAMPELIKNLREEGCNLDSSTTDGHICVADTVYKYCIPEDAPELEVGEQQMERVGGLKWPRCLRHRHKAGGDDGGDATGDEQQQVVTPSVFWLSAGDMPEEDAEYVGETPPALTHLLMTLGARDYTQYNARSGALAAADTGNDPSADSEAKEAMSTQRMLRRRYFLVEKAREANIVGIVVATLGARGYMHVLERLKKKISDAGKQSYTIVMGRVQPAKLGNFPECEVFVMLSCPESIILDCKEFYRPIITPFEADIAFSDGKMLTGSYELHMERTLLDVDEGRTTKASADEDGEEQFSFISGGYIKSRLAVSNSHAAATVGESSDYGEGVLDGERRLVNVSNARALLAQDKSQHEKSLMEVTSATEYLKLRRTYQGAEWDVPEDAPGHVKEGLTGRAASYSSEPSTRK